MALPLLGIAAMIGRAGIAAATRKFGKKAVQEAVKKGAKPRGATRNKPAPKAAPKKPAGTKPRGATRKKPTAAKKPAAPKKPATGAKKPRGATRTTGQAPRSRRAGTAPKTTRNRTGKVMAGATAASVAIPMASSVIKGGDKPVRTVKTKGGDYPVYKKSSDKAASFRKAFAAARKSGKKTFTWDGRKYNTKVK